MISRIMWALVVMIMFCVNVDGNAFTGKWRGELKIMGTKLPLVFNFNETESGGMTATMDSPQQNAKNIPFEVIYSSSDSISVACKRLNATYTGKLGDGVIKGQFIQNGYKLPLNLSPEKDLSERRPQTPKAPFPYVEKDTVFTSADGTALAGTLVIPADYKKGKKIPVVVMLTGSGPQNRDEEIFEHRPFAVIADFLAREGIASFRFDDRGTARSKGDYTMGTINTFKDDAKAAFHFVKGLSDFGKIGLLGHSEGGTLAVMIASEDKPDFIVSLAGMVIPSKETMLEQNIRLLEKYGISGSQRDDSEKLIRLLYDTIIEQYKSGVSSPVDVELLSREHSLDVPPMVIESIKRSLSVRNGYFDSLVSLDPTENLKKIKCPVLAINGTKDTQVNAEANLGAFRKYVKRAEVHSMEGLNHLMQHAGTGEISEYGEITETISPEVLDIITTFILKQK